MGVSSGELARLMEMSADDQGMCNLSPRDQLAIRDTLDMVAALANEVAAYTGESIEKVLQRVAYDVEHTKEVA